MTTVNIYEIKNMFKDSIRTYVYPQQLLYPSSISLFSNSGTITQSFFLFSTSFNSYGIYISDIIGSPSPLTIDFMSGATTINSDTITGEIGWNFISTVKTDINSGRASSLVIRSGVDVSNDYFIGKDTSSSYFYNGSNIFATAFSIGINDFVYNVFPIEVIDDNRLPVVVVDITGRPSVVDRYLSGDYAWHNFTLKAEIYGKTPAEVDRITSGIDRGLFKNRRTFSNVRLITNGNISDIGIVRPNLFTRNMTWIIKQLITRE
jgi:hypothetical protein